MRLSNKNHWFFLGQVAIFTVTLAAARGAQAAPDGWITTKTKIALMGADNVDAGDINVDTVDGRVVLHGKVRTEAEKAAAESVAKRIEGVKQVQNLLQIVAKPERERVEAADDQVKKQIETAFDQDASLDDSAIKVKSVNKGVVLLSGRSETLSDHLRALEIARSISGVYQVRTEVKSGNELAEAEVWRDEATTENVAPGTKGQEGAKTTTVGSASRDMKITTATKLRLFASDQVPATDINVDTHNGAVTLFGIVPTEEAKKVAEQEAKNVKGVSKVNNELQVVASSKKEFVEGKDDEIKKTVNKALDANKDFANIDADVKNGVVHLTGTVSSAWHELEAVRTARMQKGVRAVHSDMKTATREARGS